MDKKAKAEAKRHRRTQRKLVRDEGDAPDENGAESELAESETPEGELPASEPPASVGSQDAPDATNPLR